MVLNWETQIAGRLRHPSIPWLCHSVDVSAAFAIPMCPEMYLKRPKIETLHRLKSWCALHWPWVYADEVQLWSGAKMTHWLKKLCEFLTAVSVLDKCDSSDENRLKWTDDMEEEQAVWLYLLINYSLWREFYLIICHFLDKIDYHWFLSLCHPQMLLVAGKGSQQF